MHLNPRELDEGFHNLHQRWGSLTGLGCVQDLRWPVSSLAPLILGQVISWQLLPQLATVQIRPSEPMKGHKGCSLAFLHYFFEAVS